MGMRLVYGIGAGQGYVGDLEDGYNDLMAEIASMGSF
jgi:hypothetical protein